MFHGIFFSCISLHFRSGGMGAASRQEGTIFSHDPCRGKLRAPRPGAEATFPPRRQSMRDTCPPTLTSHPPEAPHHPAGSLHSRCKIYTQTLFSPQHFPTQCLQCFVKRVFAEESCAQLLKDRNLLQSLSSSPGTLVQKDGD